MTKIYYKIERFLKPIQTRTHVARYLTEVFSFTLYSFKQHCCLDYKLGLKGNASDISFGLALIVKPIYYVLQIYPPCKLAWRKLKRWWLINFSVFWFCPSLSLSLFFFFSFCLSFFLPSHSPPIRLLWKPFHAVSGLMQVLGLLNLVVSILVILWYYDSYYYYWYYYNNNNNDNSGDIYIYKYI